MQLEERSLKSDQRALVFVSLEVVDVPSPTNNVLGVAHSTAKEDPGAEDEATLLRMTI